MRLILLIVFLLFALVFGLFYKECGRLCVTPGQEILVSEKPFGFHWDSFDLSGETFLQDHVYSCSELVAEIDVLLTDEESQRLNSKCSKTRVQIVYPASTKLPRSLRKGDLGALVKGENEVISYSYSYLHNIIPERTPRLNELRRKFHAAVIGRKLKALYGKPLATGFVERNGAFTFLPEGPCEYWRKGNVSIMLCEKRGVFIDGIEMNLTFARLDRSQFDHAVACAIEPKYSAHCESAPAPQRPKGLVKALTTLAEWLNSRTDQCGSDGLKPLAVVSSLSDDDQARLAPVLTESHGEDLAWQAIDSYNASKENGDGYIFGVPNDPGVVYLLLHAAMQGSQTAMNEIGNMLVFCSLGVEQDFTAGLDWIEKAANADNLDAQKTLAYLHLTGKTGIADARVKAVETLKQCEAREIDIDDAEQKIRCSEILSSLTLILDAAK